ncbi:membrane protein insertion efficiency factor YidD [Pedobacter cryoconitis]|uniref:membrane protein insertion efficiency factor YidD n=1 Tax=Pedobacter cryoconitis TaxID=188932 RepID=UPI00160A3122
MRILLILLIKIYWVLIPKNKRRRCIFRISCSQYVHMKTKDKGLFKGLLALRYRFLNCRGGFHVFESPIDQSKMMVLPNQQILTEDEISERFIKKT